MKERKHFISQLAIEIDQYISADHEVELIERGVRNEVVLSENDIAFQRCTKECTVMVGRVVIGKGIWTAGSKIV